MKRYYLLSFFMIILNDICQATIWQVGPSKPYTYCSQVAALVQNGDTVDIDFAVYINDPQVLWNKNNLLLRGVGGRPRLQAGSIIANDMVNGKGIFVISGSDVRVENIEFANAVVQDNNGAGIRQEGANLYITHCKFDSNEMGILSGSIPSCKTTIEYSEFIHCGSVANPGYQHNIYINHIDTFIFRYNYSHDAVAEGHELKSRASNNFILYNRIANEQTFDSRTIDLPNGGTAVIVGNVIEQGDLSVNNNLLGYGLEGMINPGPQNIWISNNTFINRKTTGSFINIAAGTDTLFLKNNILGGAKTAGLIIGTASVLDSSNNLINNDIATFGFVNLSAYDYHLMATSAAKDAGISIAKTVYGYALQPQYMYKDSCNMETRTINAAVDIGAFEYKLPAAVGNIDATKTFAVYPNPCKDVLFFSIDDPTNYEVYNTFGQCVLRANGKQIRTGDLLPGIYFLHTDDRKITFVKEL